MCIFIDKTVIKYKMCVNISISTDKLLSQKLYVIITNKLNI